MVPKKYNESRTLANGYEVCLRRHPDETQWQVVMCSKSIPQIDSNGHLCLATQTLVREAFGLEHMRFDSTEAAYSHVFDLTRGVGREPTAIAIRFACEEVPVQRKLQR